MTRTRWIVFIAICALVLGGLVVMSKKDTVDVSKTDATKIIAESDSAIGDHVFGNKDAKVVLIEYGDLQCPACGGAFPQLKVVKETYKDSIAFVFRDFPLTALHPNALAAAAAAESAGLQGKFWEMHDQLYENQNSWSTASASERDDIFAGYAKELGLDVTKYKADLISKKVDAKIRHDQALGNKLGVNATPTLFIGDTKLDETSTASLIQGDGAGLMKKLDAAIKAAGGTVPKKTQ